jgi:O-acetyl-ADP-ribose deacetylase (regulator of RNase III)
VITSGFHLPAKYVIHAVEPIGENLFELQSAYPSILSLLMEKIFRVLGFAAFQLEHIDIHLIKPQKSN